MIKKINQKLAYTLTEVLICLTVIGVISALTIPVVHINANDKKFNAATKKAKALATDAWDYGIASGKINPRVTEVDNQDFDAFKAYFSITKDEGSSFTDKSGFEWWFGTNDIWVDVNTTSISPNNEMDQVHFCVNSTNHYLEVCEEPVAEEEN